MGDSMREAMESAFDTAAEAADEQEEETGGPEAGAEESVGASEAEAEAGGQEEPVGEEPADGGGPADEPASPEPEPVLAEADAEGDAPLLGDAEKAPVSWTPAAREHWGAIPPAAQAEINKRESDISRGLQQAAGHKRVADEYYQTVAPFQNFIQAEGSTPAQAITELMTTAAQLTMGSPAKKAEVVKNIIAQYNVDIGVLDQILSDQPVADDPNAPLLDAIDQRLAPINTFMGQVNSGREEAAHAVNTEATTELAEFQQTHAEFYEDLREDMADLMDMAANRGRSMTLEQAYERASSVHPEIGPILTQRAAAEAGKVSADALAAKRAAASSIRGSANAGGQAIPEGNDMRATMTELWDDASGDVGHG